MDQHIHLDRKNRYLDAINEFVKVGGTAINLVHKPDFNNLPRKIEDYKIAYLNTIEMSNEVRNKFGLDSIITLICRRDEEDLLISIDSLKNN